MAKVREPAVGAPHHSRGGEQAAGVAASAATRGAAGPASIRADEGDDYDAAEAEDVGAMDLDAMLPRAATEEERTAWANMSPSLRRRAAARLRLMKRWTGDRNGMTAADAAVIAGVKTKRFYEMAAAWSRDAGLAAVGAYATAPVKRSARIDARVNASLQATVAKVVDAAPDNASVEVLRRALAAAARLHLARTSPEAASLGLPSPNVMREIVAKELHRRRESARVGDSVTGDCCATTMLTTGGDPYVLFCLIDRGTRRILGHAFGSVADSVAAYGRAACDALDAMIATSPTLAWADRSRQVNLVQGSDEDAWFELRGRVAGLPRAPQFEPITNERRFGSQYRRHVGDRIGRVVFRPTWTLAAPADARGQRFDDVAAAAWVAAEVAGYNDALGGECAAGAASRPPEGLVSTLRAMAERSALVSPSP